MEWDEIQNEFDRAYGMSCKPSGLQKHKAGHIFDENMSVKWNRDKLEEENRKFQDEVSRLNTAKNKALLTVHELAYKKIQDDVGHGAVPEPGDPDDSGAAHRRIEGREQRSLLPRLPKELQSDRVQLRRRGAALSQQLRFEVTTG